MNLVDIHLTSKQNDFDPKVVLTIVLPIVPRVGDMIKLEQSNTDALLFQIRKNKKFEQYRTMVSIDKNENLSDCYFEVKRVLLSGAYKNPKIEIQPYNYLLE